jgi:hypothetical protein
MLQTILFYSGDTKELSKASNISKSGKDWDERSEENGKKEVQTEGLWKGLIQ